MAYLKSKTLFFTTSPRSPLKMIPEIRSYGMILKGKNGIPIHRLSLSKSLLGVMILMVKDQKKIWLLVQETELTEHQKL